jgi:hypothetical protein
MSDPILDAHREDPHHYVISGPAPISIRDQVLRGVMLVERLLEAGEISAERPLLVVGAGAGGASAAIQAAAQGISTTLVERNNASFLTQRLAATRIIDPIQYDWPLDHCYIGRFPWAAHHAPLPLSFAAARADQLAIRWQYELRAAAATFPSLLTVRFSTTVSNVVPVQPGDLLHVTLGSGGSIDVGAIVNAKGFGNEQCRIEYPSGTLCYEGQPFWGPDSFVTLDPSKHEVLISGAGDGALQDYLRIVTGLGRAIDIVRWLNIPSSVLQTIQSAEGQVAPGSKLGYKSARRAIFLGVGAGSSGYGESALDVSSSPLRAAATPSETGTGDDRLSRAVYTELLWAQSLPCRSSLHLYKHYDALPWVAHRVNPARPPQFTHLHYPERCSMARKRYLCFRSAGQS